MGEESAETDARRIEGTFRVSRGRGWLSRFLAWCLRLPLPGEAVPLRLTITPEGDRERWIRQFGERRVETLCSRQLEGRWHERFGLLEFEFSTRRERDTTVHDQRRCRFVLGPLSVPLPARLSPSVNGVEQVLENGSMSVHVVLSAPLAGKLLEYSGVVPVREGL